MDSKSQDVSNDYKYTMQNKRDRRESKNTSQMSSTPITLYQPRPTLLIPLVFVFQHSIVCADSFHLNHYDNHPKKGQNNRKLEKQTQKMSSTAAPKHFDISQLPSLKAGMTAEEETTKRRKTCRFIEEAGKRLKLPRVAVATAMVFFHRFYAKHSFLEHDRFEVAVASIVLAAKTEESPKKLKDVIDECCKLKQGGMNGEWRLVWGVYFYCLRRLRVSQIFIDR